MHRILHLQHHAHTGKVLRHHHTSYRSLALVLLIAGVVCLGVKHAASAADLAVYAKVPAAVPSQPAIITDPTDTSSADRADIIVQGSCQYLTPGTVIAIYINTVQAGSTPCSTSGSFGVPVRLEPGASLIVARTVNVTDDYGPDSTPVSVTYTPPAVPDGSGKPAVQGTATNADSGSGGTSGGGTDSSSSQTAGSPLTITPRQLFVLYWRSHDAVWSADFSGGTPPYTATMSWGDGQVDTLTGLRSGIQTLRHQYDKLDRYTARIELRDSAGDMRFAHIAVVASTVQYVPATPDNPLVGGITTETIAVRLYLTMVAMIGILWFYERLLHPVAQAVVHRKQ